MKKSILLILLLSLVVNLNSQNRSNVQYTHKDIEIYNNLVKHISPFTDSFASFLVIKTAMQLLGTPYVAGTLEVNGSDEKLIINLHETDCILFAETCLAFAQTIKSGNTDFNNFINNVAMLRYRDGIVDGYCSRIHYTSEWLSQGMKNGFFIDMSRQIDSIKVPQKLYFMSKYYTKYPQLKSSKSAVKKIKEIEHLLNRQAYYYIPKAMVKSALPFLRSGDIVCFNTSTPGIDISHVGIIYVDVNRNVRFVHASMKEGKVVVDRSLLVDYINSFSLNNGIRIVRPC